MGNGDDTSSAIPSNLREGKCIITHSSHPQGVNKLTIFSKFTILSMKVLLPSWVNVISEKRKTIKRESNDNSDMFEWGCTFEKEGHEGDDWWLQFGDSQSVGSVVSWWVLPTKRCTLCSRNILYDQLSIIKKYLICRHLRCDATYHHILKFSIKLLKLSGELLQGNKQRCQCGSSEAVESPVRV